MLASVKWPILKGCLRSILTSDAWYLQVPYVDGLIAIVRVLGGVERDLFAAAVVLILEFDVLEPGAVRVPTSIGV